VLFENEQQQKRLVVERENFGGGIKS